MTETTLTALVQRAETALAVQPLDPLQRRGVEKYTSRLKTDRRMRGNARWQTWEAGQQAGWDAEYLAALLDGRGRYLPSDRVALSYTPTRRVRLA
jgi:hypothetical protein